MILIKAILLLVIQCLIATFLDAVIVGCIFIKISKPKNRTDTIIFSDKDSSESKLKITFGHFPSNRQFKNFRIDGKLVIIEIGLEWIGLNGWVFQKSVQLMHRKLKFWKNFWISFPRFANKAWYGLVHDPILKKLKWYP